MWGGWGSTFQIEPHDAYCEEHGEVVMVVRLDRLARSTMNLLNVLDGIAKLGAGFKSPRDQY